MKKTFNEVCKGINWSKLSTQKRTLIKLRGKHEDTPVSDITPQHKKDLDNIKGLIAFIDDLQDSAIESHGLKEEEVFPFLTNIRLIHRMKSNVN